MTDWLLIYWLIDWFQTEDGSPRRRAEGDDRRLRGHRQEHQTSKNFGAIFFYFLFTAGQILPILGQFFVLFFLFTAGQILQIWGKYFRLSGHCWSNFAKFCQFFEQVLSQIEIFKLIFKKKYFLCSFRIKWKTI